MTDNTPEKAEVFRAKYSVDLTHSASTAEWKYYESRQTLANDLLAAQLDVLVASGNSHSERHIWRRRKLWRDFLKGDDDYPKVKQILSVDRFDNGVWIPVGVTFTEPSITFDGEVV
jgi:hypothetical protein